MPRVFSSYNPNTSVDQNNHDPLRRIALIPRFSKRYGLFLRIFIVVVLLIVAITTIPTNARDGWNTALSDTAKPISSLTANGFFPLTADNIAFGYVLPGPICQNFSPDGTLLAIGHVGMYEVATGKERFPLSNSTLFSPDGSLVIVQRDGVYETSTGRKRFPFDPFSEGVFSPDGTLVSVYYDGIYEVATGHKRLLLPFVVGFSRDGKLLVGSDNKSYGLYETSTGKRRFALPDLLGSAVFSPDNTLMALNFIDKLDSEGKLVARNNNDGIYETATGNKRLDGSFIFSPDGTLLVGRINDEYGVYEIATGHKRFATSNKYGSIFFSPDRTLLAKTDDGVYEVATGHKRFAIDGVYSAHFSPDGSLLAVGQDGVYETATGHKRFALSNNDIGFTPDGKLLIVSADGVYETTVGRKILNFSGSFPILSRDGTLVVVPNGATCNVYGAKNNQWPFERGLIHVGTVNFRRSFEDDDKDLSTIHDENLVVTARTSDGEWYQVIYKDEIGWVTTSNVDIISMPDDVEVITPYYNYQEIYG